MDMTEEPIQPLEPEKRVICLKKVVGREDCADNHPARDGDRSGGRGREDRNHNRNRNRNRGDSGHSQASPVAPAAVAKVDERMPQLGDDPRLKASRDGQAVHKVQKTRGGGRNTESFDPESTLVRPEMRVLVGPVQEQYNKTLKHDDVLIVPNFFCEEDDWSLYYKLVEEMRAIQADNVKGSEWISWHEGSHLISKNPEASPTYQMVLDRVSKYFGIERKSVGTRFNWYVDSSDWKPFHHDSAAFNPQRAKNQNITVGVSFGATRELAFLHAHNGTRIYVPQTNGMMFSFGRDANINWKHGVNALEKSEQDGKGRVSIILWGLVKNVKEESNSPPLLTDNTRGNGHSIHARHTGTRSDGGDRRRDGDREGDRNRGRDSRDRDRDSRERERVRDNENSYRERGDRDGGRDGDRGRGRGRDWDHDQRGYGSGLPEGARAFEGRGNGHGYNQGQLAPHDQQGRDDRPEHRRQARSRSRERHQQQQRHFSHDHQRR